jgi:hypothetical protein
MEYYSAIKKSEIMFAGKWMEVENTILSKISQDQNIKLFSLILEARSKRQMYT